MTGEEATDLLNLQCLWRDAYAITFHDGVLSARRDDHPAAILTADTALELRGLLRDDDQSSWAAPPGHPPPR